MDLSLTVVDAATGRREDVLLVTEPDATVAAVETALSEALRFTQRGHAQVTALHHVAGRGSSTALRERAVGGGLWATGARLDPDVPVARSGLHDGAVVALGGPRQLAVDDVNIAGVTEVRVVSGPAAGQVTRLGFGDSTLGSGPDADARIADPAIADLNATLRVSPTAVEWRDLSQPQAQPRVLAPEDLVAVGDSLLHVRPVEAPDAALSLTVDGGLDYNRPPRLPPEPVAERVEMPTPPREPERRAFPVLAMLLPLVFGVVMAVVIQDPRFLLFTLMSPVMLVGTTLSDRRTGRKSHRQRVKEYEQRREAAEQRIADAVTREQRESRSNAPDPATLLLTATGPRRRLWERRRGDADRLVLRVGSGALPASVEIVQQGGVHAFDQEQPKLQDVPVTVPLRDVGVLGVAGPRGTARAVVRSLVGQVAALHSPRDTSIVLMVDRSHADDAADEWSWIRWLPHSRPADGSIPCRVGNTPDGVARRVTELAALVADRTAAVRDAFGRVSVDRADQVVVVLDGARALRGLPGMPQVLSEGPAVGVYAICLDDEQRLLPEECAAVVAVERSSPGRATVRRAFGPVLEPVLLEPVSTLWAERLARALAPIRDASRDEDDVQLPTSLRLLDVLALEPPTPTDVLSRWQVGGRNTVAVLGESVDGPLAVDVRRDGPHALIAGTTGAGKSELLQTLVASLAIANRPDAFSFVLVDYKGGSAFKDCARLPHTVGLVTDLDGHLTERALTSLSAELRRREHILGRVGAKDIEDYWEAAGSGDEPLARLMLVIDEFAALVEELPDFVKGLVGIAQRGRSLGVHLVLATQRPGGVVTPEIRANTNLRIALRVTDDTESRDVVDAPDAARIARSTPGRGYVRTGHASLTAFQAGRIGGRRPGATPVALEPYAVVVPWSRLAEPVARRQLVAVDEHHETDLQVLVDGVIAANHELGVAPPTRPWLPPLPELLSVEDLPALGAAAQPSGILPLVPIGLEDLPDEQSQRTVALDLDRGSHLLVAGAPRTGRSTVLRTLAGGIAAGMSSADVHVFGIDCGNGALLPVADLPHCGAVVTRDQVDRVDRLLTRLTDEVTRRQSLLAQAGYADLAEQREHAGPEDRLSYVVLLLDRWEGFTAAFEELDAGRIPATLLRLLREGPGVGLRAVVTSDRSGLIGRLSTTIEDKLILRLGDRSDFGLAGLSARQLPDRIPAGRAFRADTTVETQLALLTRDASGPAQVARLRELAAAAVARDANLPHSKRPMRVDVLPARVTLQDVLALTVAQTDSATTSDLAALGPPEPLWALVGVGGDELGPVGIDLQHDGPVFIVGGRPRSGRSTALLVMALSLVARGCAIVAVTPRPSPLRDLREQPGVLGVLPATADDAELSALVADALGPVVVIVDDAELLVDAPLGMALETYLRESRDSDRALVIGGTTGEMQSGFRGFLVEARKGKTGLLLSPESPMDGELLGIRPPRSATGAAPLGRGLFTLRSTFSLVQIPDASI